MNYKYDWLALAVGNSRLHWARFEGLTLIETWDTKHLTNAVKPHQLPNLCMSANSSERLLEIPVYLASVVPEQTALWREYHQLNLLSLNDVELSDIYPTMGIDRALAAWGGISNYQQPCLVIDAGTALTFTGVDRQKLIGGAILPGLRSQLITLQQKTAALPQVQLRDSLPPRWASNTADAIASGIIYTAIAGIYSYIMDWLQLFPTGKIIFTGGDGKLCSKYLQLQFPEIEQTIVDPNLIFWGIRLVYQQQRKI